MNASTPEPVQPEPDRLGPYRLVERIGEGGMGVVHLAVGPSGELVAVKALRPWLVGGHEARSRFERELATLRLVKGPRIAEVVDADVAGDPPYIVTRYVRGSTLDKVVADHGPLRGPALARLASGLAEALASVHASGVVHRDVKPGNVLVTEDGPVLIDFGLARALDETRLTATGLVIGTPGYLAPEVVHGHTPSPATDVHGWATTIAFAATGRPPYGTGPDAVVLDRIRRGEHDLAGVEPGLASWLNRGLAADPALRPSVSEILVATSASDATAVISPPPLTAPVPSPGPPTRIELAPAASGSPAPPARARPPAPPPRPTSAPRREWTGPPGAAPPLRTWPARLAVGAAWVVLLILCAVNPRAGLVALLVVMVVTRTTWRVRLRLYERRIARGHQAKDAWVMAAGTPWHLAVTAVQSAFHLVWISAAAFLVGAAISLGEQAGPRLPYLAGAVVAILLGWLGPATARIRNGTRVLAAPLDRNPRAAWIAFGVLVAISWVLLLVWDSYGTGWPPLDDLPNPLDAAPDPSGLVLVAPAKL